jgi:hypothetical protein
VEEGVEPHPLVHTSRCKLADERHVFAQQRAAGDKAPGQNRSSGRGSRAQVVDELSIGPAVFGDVGDDAVCDRSTEVGVATGERLADAADQVGMLARLDWPTLQGTGIQAG